VWAPRSARPVSAAVALLRGGVPVDLTDEEEEEGDHESFARNRQEEGEEEGEVGGEVEEEEEYAALREEEEEAARDWQRYERLRLPARLPAREEQRWLRLLEPLGNQSAWGARPPAPAPPPPPPLLLSSLPLTLLYGPAAGRNRSECCGQGARRGAAGAARAR